MLIMMEAFFLLERFFTRNRDFDSNNNHYRTTCIYLLALLSINTVLAYSVLPLMQLSSVFDVHISALLSKGDVTSGRVVPK